EVHERGTGVVEAKPGAAADAGRLGGGVLLVPDELLVGAQAATAVVLRPRNASPAGVVHGALPVQVKGFLAREIAFRRPLILWLVGVQPFTDFITKVTKVYCLTMFHRPP